MTGMNSLCFAFAIVRLAPDYGVLVSFLYSVFKVRFAGCLFGARRCYFIYVKNTYSLN